MINVFYLSDNPYGGWVTFTHHLIRSLELMGEEVRLFKVKPNFEDRERDFGYGHTYQNIDAQIAAGVAASGGSVITAVDKRHMATARLLREHGAHLVVHDPTEFKYLQGVADWDRVITIRHKVHQQLPKSTFIPHPYVRFQTSISMDYETRKAAVSVARIDFDKRTDILLDANRILRARGAEPITIRGFENRIYTRFNIVQRYPEWVQSVGHFPREEGIAFNLCQQHKFMVDMSEIKGDGGGTQYSFLEAMDAGTVCVLNTAWGEGEMQDMENCVMVSDGGQLADIISEGIDDSFRDELIYGGHRILMDHCPSLIGPQYQELLQK